MDPKSINTNPLGSTLGSVSSVVDGNVATPVNPVVPQNPVEPVTTPAMGTVGPNPFISEEPTAPESVAVEPLAGSVSAPAVGAVDTPPVEVPEPTVGEPVVTEHVSPLGGAVGGTAKVSLV